MAADPGLKTLTLTCPCGKAGTFTGTEQELNRRAYVAGWALKPRPRLGRTDTLCPNCAVKYERETARERERLRQQMPLNVLAFGVNWIEFLLGFLAISALCLGILSGLWISHRLFPMTLDATSLLALGASLLILAGCFTPPRFGFTTRFITLFVGASVYLLALLWRASRSGP